MPPRPFAWRGAAVCYPRCRSASSMALWCLPARTTRRARARLHGSEHGSNNGRPSRRHFASVAGRRPFSAAQLHRQLSDLRAAALAGAAGSAPSPSSHQHDAIELGNAGPKAGSRNTP